MRAADSYLRPVAVGVLVVAVAYALYQLADVAMLVFGGIVVATVLRAIASLVERLHRVPERVAYGIALGAFLALIGGLLWLVGARIARDIGQLVAALPDALDAARGWMATLPLGDMLVRTFDGAAEGALPIGRLAGFTNLTLGALTSLLLILLLGIYLAADPHLYRRGLLHLVPAREQPRVDAALRSAGRKLHQWLIAQLVLMVVVGLLTGLGMALIGTQAALVLGLIAGMTEFVPFLGPIASGFVAALVAFGQGPEQALYTVIVVVAIQQLEGNLLTPLVQRWAAQLAPALALAAIVAFGVLFGVPGIVFAVPLTLVVIAFVEQLYVAGIDAAGEG